MARKRNVEAYGKSWSPIDIQNLEKAVKLYERLNYLNDHFADSLSGSNNIWKQINEKAEIQEELQKLGVKHSKEQCEYVIKLANNQEKVNSKIITAAQLAKNTAGTGGTSFSLSNVGSLYQQKRLETDAASALHGALSSAGKQVKKGTFTKGSTEYANYVNQYAADKMAASANKYSTSAAIIQVAANAFSDAVSVFGKLLGDGYNNQRRVYEDTFTNISVRNGTTRGQYFGAQARTNNILGSMGLANNVRTSQVQSMWNTLASNGLNVDLSEERRAQTIANAIETVVTSTIVPYLDVSSAYFQQLSDQQPNLMKQIRGIGLATQDLTGSSVFVTKYLQDMVDSLGPMASLAENQLGVQFAQMSGTYESLRAQGLSDATIGELYKGSAALYNDPLAALRSDNLDLKLAASMGIANGIDFRDISQVTGQYLKSADWVSNLVPEGNMSPIFAGMLNTYLSTTGSTELNERNLDIITAIMSGKKVGGSLSKYSSLATSNFTGDVNQTAKTLQEITMENIMTNVAVISQQLGYWGDVIAGLLKGLLGVLGAKVVGSIGSKLLGIGGGAGGAGLLAGNLGANLAVSGSTIVGNGASTGLALGAGVAGATAGIGMGVYGGVKAYENFKEGDYGIGATYAAGGAAGIGGAVALGLGAGPVGWAALAVGGIVLAGAAAWDYAESLTKSEDNIMQAGKQITDKWNAVGEQLQEEIDTRTDGLHDIKEGLEDNYDLEVMRKQLIDTGLLTEEDLEKARQANRDGLIELTNAYIVASEQFGEKGQEILDYFSDKEAYSYGDQMLDLNKWWEENKNYQKGNANYDEMKFLVDTVYKDLKNKGYDNLNDAQKKVYDAYISKGEGGYTRHELEQILDGSLSNGKQFTELGLSEEALGRIANSKYASTYGVDDYTDYDDAVVNTLAAAASTMDPEIAKQYLVQLKEKGITSDSIKYGQKIKDIMQQHNIESYRTGLNKVPYDNYLANLHEGEAVLTASTASELRNLITTFRETNNQGFVIDAAIANQTTIIVSKLDEVVKAVQQINSATGPSGWGSGVRNSMRTMTNTKVFG